MDLLLSVVSLCIHFRYVLGAYASLTDEVSAVLDKLLDNYNKDVRPGLGDQPVLIETHVSIRSFGKISEMEMDYSFQCYLRQRWHDDRLKFHMDNVTEFTLSNRFLQYIWKPNTYFLNGKNSKAHNITVPNAFVRIRNDGHLYMSRRLTVNAKCPMHLHSYPMGKIKCPLKLGSFGYTTDDMQYFWKSGHTSVDTYEGLTMSTFELGIIETYNTTSSNTLGKFSILGVDIHMHRHIGFYILQTYLPCYLITSLSWISFWINSDAAPARVLLGVTTILSTAAIGMTVREGLPRVPYATALDIFLNVCLVYEMAALIEYAAVNYFITICSKLNAPPEEDEEEIVPPPPQRKAIYVNETDEREREILIEGDEYIEMETSRYNNSCCASSWRCLIGSSNYRPAKCELLDYEPGTNVNRIDKTARIMFPGSFIILNSLYWIGYLYLMES
ncbi:gamma-aminobutyric acid receptor subunit gamma-2-like [Haliotis rufescens]|uniref:gamma-aminobutyric acid receptor subunit gamma-2-like n=1 Tax=Haliotis rufescens TaxID=6454 RepID=UPI001EB03D35|nr:gamma-aminobutyric acid receptor subunit gamma-2-like [Haliotis rufescens]